ncbi:MAG: phosphoribosyltransferase [Proteobacteria bacterium]|jgi:hypoxanthine phosphoribosyltransferase|nr:phosphoribosyltransferase [Desulfocapsa sp.]MBU3943174.1 phosphoribosyltransferase [Pseudomonadota bacterium]MCG2745055.1 phosphoribosyltransferase [Desulfobacteraceae bacterium]MBU3982711.1 phosphoribosyltransferase [Pseudomonadota bacterium]MBU4030329.1 phosphoribosyltransferase [Pseudomonadota bacterium]
MSVTILKRNTQTDDDSPISPQHEMKSNMIVTNSDFELPQFTGIEKLILSKQQQLLRFLGCDFFTLQDINEMCETLYHKINQDYTPEAVVGISTGGYYPAYQIAQLFGVPNFEIHISRDKDYWNHLELNDLIGFRKLFPERCLSLKEPFIGDIEGRKILVIDDDYRTQASLDMAITHMAKAGAAEIKEAVLVEPDAGINQKIYSAKQQVPINRFIKGKFRFPWNQHSLHYHSYLEWTKAQK